MLEDLDLRLDADDRTTACSAPTQRQEHFRQADRGAICRRWRGAAMPPTRSWSATSPSTRWTICPPARPLQHMLDLMPDATECRSGDSAGDARFQLRQGRSKAENLSGGEKARLLFALAPFTARIC